MNILVVYPYIPYPIDRGTYQRVFHLLRALARDHTVDLIALAENGERMEHRGVFEAFCRHVTFVPFEHPRWPSLFPDRLCHSLPTTIRHWHVPALGEAIAAMLERNRYDLAHVCDIVMAQYFLDTHRGLPLSVDRSRVDLQFQREQHARMPRSLKSELLYREQMWKLERFEKRVAKRSALQVVCGPDDEDFIRAEISSGVPVQVVTNGVDLDYFHPGAADNPRDEQPTVLFCGAMDYLPNIDALRWFFAGIHQRLLERVPDLQVLIVGKSPVEEVLGHAKRPGVTVTGGVPDVRPYYRRAWAQIVPLRIGGGTRLKIPESMAVGTPVISTSIGAQGLHLEHGREILLADSEQAFVEETERLLRDAALRQHIAQHGLETCRARFGWPGLGRQLSAAYEMRFQETAPREDSTAQARGNRSGPPLAMLGVPFDNITTAQTLNEIGGMIASGQPHFVATANVDFTAQAMHDEHLRRVLLEAHLVVCDGMPLVWASRWLGNPLPERVAGSDLVPKLLAQAEARGWSVFFLGGQEEVARKAVANVRQRHPGLKIAGTLSPEFKPLHEMDHEGICAAIRASKPDLLLVSFGCPKQEKWIAMNYRRAGAAVAIGVGATIDFLAGHMQRAPRWMQVSGLEWVFRLAQEPRRLFKRYATDFWVFGRAIVKQWWLTRGRRGEAAARMSRRDTATASAAARVPVAELALPSRLDAAEVAEIGQAWLQIARQAENGLIIDCSGTQFIDSTGLGLLARLFKQCRQEGRQMVLASCSRAVDDLLRMTRLSAVFTVAENHHAARSVLAPEATLNLAARA